MSGSDADASCGHIAGTTMLRLERGEFVMGSDDHYREEAPARLTAVEAFSIDAHPVTNERFATFVAETGYVSVAERSPDPTDPPDD